MYVMNYLQPIAPNRFVFHISPKKNRDAINQLGIKAFSSKVIGYENQVFAHNSQYIDLNWYPIVMNYYSWEYWYDFDNTISFPDDRKALLQMVPDIYDIWAIDTALLNRKWCIDEIGQKEFGGSFFNSKQLYITTTGDVPRDCIQLCDIKMTEINYKAKWGNLICYWPVVLPMRAKCR